MDAHLFYTPLWTSCFQYTYCSGNDKRSTTAQDAKESIWRQDNLIYWYAAII